MQAIVDEGCIPPLADLLHNYQGVYYYKIQYVCVSYMHLLPIKVCMIIRYYCVCLCLYADVCVQMHLVYYCIHTYVGVPEAVLAEVSAALAVLAGNGEQHAPKLHI